MNSESLKRCYGVVTRKRIRSLVIGKIKDIQRSIIFDRRMAKLFNCLGVAKITDAKKEETSV